MKRPQALILEYHTNVSVLWSLCNYVCTLKSHSYTVICKYFFILNALDYAYVSKIPT